MSIYVVYVSMLCIVLVILFRTTSFLFQNFDHLNKWRVVQHMLEIGIAIGSTIALIYLTFALQRQDQQINLDDENISEASSVETEENILILPTKTVKL